MTSLPGVDRRHGHGRGEAPALARSMTALPGLGTLPGVDRRHHGDRGTMTGLPGVSLPLELAGVDRHHGRHVGTTGTAARCQVDDRGTMTGLPSCPASIVGTTGTAAGRPRRLPGR